MLAWSESSAFWSEQQVAQTKLHQGPHPSVADVYPGLVAGVLVGLQESLHINDIKH